MMKMENRTIMQDTKMHQEIQSSVSKVECYVCGKGLSFQLKQYPMELYYFAMFIIQYNKKNCYFSTFEHSLNF